MPSAAGTVLLSDGVVELAGPPGAGTPEAWAALGLRAARLVAGGRPGPKLLAWLEGGPYEPVAWSGPARAELFALLRSGTAGSWRFLERTGLLTSCLPELGRLRTELRDRQGDRPWDQLETLARCLDPSLDPAAAAAWLALAAPEHLLLAALARAVGEGARRGRARTAARRTTERLGLDAAGQQAVAALVGDDGDLAELAARTDPHDEEQVLGLAARIGTPEQARMAYLLALGEDRGAWREGWRRALLDELLRVVLAAMVEPGLTDHVAERLVHRRRAEVELAIDGAGPGAAALLAAAPRRYLLGQPAEAIARHLAMAEPAPARRELRLAISPEPAGGRGGAWRVDAVTRDRPGLLARLVGALSACGLDITRAQASTWPDDLVVDVFHVAGPAPEDEPGLPDRVERMLRRAMEGDLDPVRLLAERPDGNRAGPVVVRVDAGASPWHSTVRVEAPDRPGLLYEILLELARHHVDVQAARVGDGAGMAADLFLVTDAAGNPLEREAADRLGTALAGRLTDPAGRQRAGGQVRR